MGGGPWTGTLPPSSNVPTTTSTTSGTSSTPGQPQIQVAMGPAFNFNMGPPMAPPPPAFGHPPIGNINSFDPFLPCRWDKLNLGNINTLLLGLFMLMFSPFCYSAPTTCLVTSRDVAPEGGRPDLRRLAPQPADHRRRRAEEARRRPSGSGHKLTALAEQGRGRPMTTRPKISSVRC